jgi:hypothetical protein
MEDMKNIMVTEIYDDSLIMTSEMYTNLTALFSNIIKRKGFKTKLVLLKETIGKEIIHCTISCKPNYRNNSVIKLLKSLA